MENKNTLYGKIESEKYVENIKIARDIVREITSFGVSEEQLILIIKFLSMELEDFELSRDIINLIKDKKDNLSIINRFSGDNENDLLTT